jgi:hypothetical protein
LRLSDLHSPIADLEYKSEIADQHSPILPIGNIVSRFLHACKILKVIFEIGQGWSLVRKAPSLYREANARRASCNRCLWPRINWSEDWSYFKIKVNAQRKDDSGDRIQSQVSGNSRRT